MAERYRLIQAETSIMPACDVETLQQLRRMMKVTTMFPQIISYKVGFDLGLGYGLPAVVDAVKTADPSAVVIYDHQKAGTDIPKTGKKFARRMRKSGIDAAIIFPQAGPVTGEAWIKYLQDEGVGVMVGGEMTHKGYKASEGGFINDEALERMYILGAENGVTEFIVPGNRVERIAFYQQLLQGLGISPVFSAPGFVDQLGNITEAGNVIKGSWHAICGGACYNPEGIDDLNDVTEEEMYMSIERLVSQLHESF